LMCNPIPGNDTPNICKWRTWAKFTLMMTPAKVSKRVRHNQYFLNTL
jgi:hypothetical protein